VQADQCLETGAVFAWIVEADEALPLRAPVNGPFLAWLVMDGQRVPPGHPVALFRAVSSSDHSDFAPTSQEERP